MFFIISNLIWPIVTNTVVYQQNVNKMDFPVEYLVCVKPGFLKEKVPQNGYSDLDGYFHGQSRYNSSIFGWSGNFLDNHNISERGIPMFQVL